MPDDVKSVVANEPDEGHDHAHGPDQPGLVHLQPALADHAVPDGVGHRGRPVRRPAARRAERRPTPRWSSRPTRRTRRSRRSPRPRSPARPCARTSRGQSGFDPKNPKAPNNSLKTYATNPLWQVVDGPWHLTQVRLGWAHVTMEPNPKYSGPVKPKIDKFVQLPFTSNAAEFNALVGGKITVGYLPLRGRDVAREEPARPRQEPPAPLELQPRPVVLVGHHLLPLQLQLDRQRRAGREDLPAALLPPGVPAARSTSRCTSRRSTRTTPCRPTGRCRCSRRTPSRPSSRPRTPTRTTRRGRSRCSRRTAGRSTRRA